MPSFYSLLRYFSFQSPQTHLSLKEKNNPMFNSSWPACIRLTCPVKKKNQNEIPFHTRALHCQVSHCLFVFLTGKWSPTPSSEKHLTSVLLIPSYEFVHSYNHMPLLLSKGKCDYFRYISNFLVLLLPFAHWNVFLLFSFLPDSWGLEIFIFINEIRISTWSRRYDNKAKSEAIKLSKIDGVSHSTVNQMADMLTKLSSVISQMHWGESKKCAMNLWCF